MHYNRNFEKHRSRVSKTGCEHIYTYIIKKKIIIKARMRRNDEDFYADDKHFVVRADFLLEVKKDGE